MTAPWRLRGYSIGQLLGSGASSDVWRARVTASGEQVALKRIRVDDAVAAERAQAEAALLSALDHPHLVRLHALVRTDDAAVLVLDLADGGSLAQLLAARGRLTPGEVITAVAPVAAALAYLHDEGVVHGDVSPANILFTRAGVPLLADVGVARLTGDDRTAATTPAYVDPSVAAGCVPGPRSDVFMLAAVALHALTGRPVWPGSTASEALAQAAAGRLDDLPDRLAEAGVSEEMSRVVRRALEPDPHRRGTAADLALDLRHSGEPVAVELAAGRERWPDPERAPGPRHLARPGAASGPSAGGSGAGGSGAGGSGAGGSGAGEPGSGGAAGNPIDPARPEFERPSAAPGGAGLAPPTRMVGPRPRPVIPRPVPSSRRRRALLLALAATVVVLLGTAGTVWASTDAGSVKPASTKSTAARTAGRTTAPPATPAVPGPRSASAAEPGSSSVVPSSAVPSSAVPSSATPARQTRSAAAAVAWPATTSVAAWSRVLDGLDALRARAFADRDAGLLARVYASATLLRADTGRLRRIVAPGCGLAGVRTTYRDLRVTTAGRRMIVTAEATLAPSRLICDGRPRGTAAGVGPDRLRIELVRVGSAARIADQQRR